MMSVSHTASAVPMLLWKEQLTSSAYCVDCKNRAELIASYREGVLPRDQLPRNQLPRGQFPPDQLPTRSIPTKSTQCNF